jgi:hypothetical protein
MTGTNPLLDPDGSRRAAMASSLEYGTHSRTGQQALERPVAPVFPRCGICGRPRVLFAGVCHSCIAKDEELDR